MNVINFYDAMASEFSESPHERFYETVASNLLAIAPGVLVRSVVEVGAGCGFATRKIKECYPKARLVALEPASAMLDIAKRRVPGVTWIGQTMGDFEPGEPFDLVISSMSYHWLSDNERNKLLTMGKSVLLAVPVAGTARTNRFLVDLVRERNRRVAWEKDVRDGRSVTGHVKRYFRHVHTVHLDLQERFDDRSALVDALYRRGVLTSLFDGQAERARESLELSVPKEPCFNWDIKLIAGTNHGGRNG